MYDLLDLAFRGEVQRSFWLIGLAYGERMNVSLFGLPVASTSAWIFNCYVIDAGSGLVVVDPGLPIVARQALTMIERDLDRSAADVTTILCTHAHPDHIAGVSTLTASTPCGAHLPQRCESYLSGEKPRNFALIESSLRFMPVWSGQPFSLRALGQFARYGKTIGIGGPAQLTLDFEPDGFVADGDEVPDATGWQTIHAPGHTDDSTCFYHAETATLISGDAVVTHNGTAWFNPEYVDRYLAAETEARLRSLEVRHLLPGHGELLALDDVWRSAKSFTDPPTGSGMLARCSRRFGKW